MKITTKTTKQVTYRLLGEDVVRLLDIPENAQDVEVVVSIPSGGDYSGMTLDLDFDVPIFVSFTLETE